MSELHKVNPGRGLQLRQTGVFDLEKIYRVMKEWINQNKYNFNEKDHTEKAGDKGKEVILEWVSEREVTDYLKMHIATNILFINLHPLKEGLVKGKVKITFTAGVISDYKNNFGKSLFTHWLFKLYENYIIKSEIEKYEDKLQEELEDFHNITKEALDFHR